MQIGTRSYILKYEEGMNKLLQVHLGLDCHRGRNIGTF